MILVGNNATKIAAVLTIIATLQILYCSVTVAITPTSIVRKVVPDCIYGVDSLSFILYTRKYPSGKDVNITDMHLPIQKGKEFIILIHGFYDDANNTNFFYLTRALLNKNDVNIFSLEWKDAACFTGPLVLDFLSYGSAVKNVPSVGEYTANFTIHLMKHYGLSLNTTIVVGHSLGAHVASYASKRLHKEMYQKYFEIVGLEPAGPGFSQRPRSERLSKSDADIVQVFHTTYIIGLQEAIGDYDFYFNGGGLQPKCGIGVLGSYCSHIRSIDYLTASLVTGCFIGTPSRDGTRRHAEISAKDCTPNLCTNPGLVPIKGQPKGTFYVGTGSSSPFCTPR